MNQEEKPPGDPDEGKKFYPGFSPGDVETGTSKIKFPDYFDERQAERQKRALERWEKDDTKEGEIPPGWKKPGHDFNAAKVVEVHRLPREFKIAPQDVRLVLADEIMDLVKKLGALLEKKPSRWRRFLAECKRFWREE